MQTFFLHLSSLGWRFGILEKLDFRVPSLKSTPFIREHAWTTSHWPVTPQQGVEQGVRELILRHGQGVLENAESIVILLDFPGMRYSDGKDRLLTSDGATESTIRLFGSVLLNVPEVTYGSLPLQEKKEKEEALYAFADATLLRELLSLFDKIGLKIHAVTSLPLLLVQHFLQASSSTSAFVYGGLCLGEMETTVVLVNTELNNHTIRSLPVGLATLTQALAMGNNLSLSEAALALENQEILNGIYLNGSEHAQAGFHEQALIPLLEQLWQGIQESIDFFTIHRASGRPETLEVLGDTKRIAGIVPWLQRHLKISLEANPILPLELYTKLAHSEYGNLLKGAENSLLSVGRTKYYYSRAGFVRSKAMLTDENSSIITADPPTIVHNNTAPLLNTKWSLSALWAQIKQKISLTVAPAKKKSMLRMAPSQIEISPILGIGGACVVLLFMWIINEYHTKEMKYQTNIKSYLRVSQENDQIRHSQSMRQNKSTDLDKHKVLWSEKWLALTKQMDPSLWLTELYFDHSKSPKGGAGQMVVMRKLILKGKVLPSTEGPMKKVTAFMDRLLQDKTGFMQGLQSIQFLGAEEEPTPQGIQVHFTLEVSYDESKDIPLEAKKTGSDDLPTFGLSEMQHNVDQHNKALEEIVSEKKR
ncbi:MAG: hypothetical protein H7832_09550 [Magnetococcus sp. DMHC-6]